MTVLLGALTAAPAIAGILDPLNPFYNGNVAPLTPEAKARRDQARTELYDRLSPGYAMSVPFISEAAVGVAATGHRALSADRSCRRLAGDAGEHIA